MTTLTQSPDWFDTLWKEIEPRIPVYLRTDAFKKMARELSETVRGIIDYARVTEIGIIDFARVTAILKGAQGANAGGSGRSSGALSKAGEAMKKEPYPGASKDRPAMRRLILSFFDLVEEVEKRTTTAEFERARRESMAIMDRAIANGKARRKATKRARVKP